MNGTTQENGEGKLVLKSRNSLIQRLGRGFEGLGEEGRCTAVLERRVLFYLAIIAGTQYYLH